MAYQFSELSYIFYKYLNPIVSVNFLMGDY